MIKKAPPGAIGVFALIIALATVGAELLSMWHDATQEPAGHDKAVGTASLDPSAKVVDGAASRHGP